MKTLTQHDELLVKPYIDSKTQTLTDNVSVLAENGAVNKLPNNATPRTISGIRIDVNSDKSITISGSGNSATFNIFNDANNPIVINKDCIFSCNATTQNWEIIATATDGTTYSLKQSTGDNIRIPAGKNIERVFWHNNDSYNQTTTIYPMIAYADYSGDYVPYAKTNGELTSDIQTLTNNDDAMLNVLGAKNLLLCNNTTQIVRGITYQLNSDGSVSTSGSVASGYDYSFFHVNEYQKLPKGKYILSGCYPNGSIDKWRLYIVVNGTNYIDYGEGVEFELAEDETIDVIIRIESGYVSDGMTFYPMIRPYNITDDSYVPYCMTNAQLTKRIAIVEGTTPATTKAPNTIVNFPDGFTRDNSMIISIGIYNNNAYRYEDKNYGVSAVATGDNIQVFVRETVGCGLNFRLMLMKIV